jgi:hypothetical protein
MSKTFLALLTALFIPYFTVYSQETSKEAGKYERKSVTYINALWLMDESAHRLAPEQVGVILDKVKQGITMKRFDYNPVPSDSLCLILHKPKEAGKISRTRCLIASPLSWKELWFPEFLK